MVKTLPEVEQAIAQYQTHIGQLQKVIRSGSPSGKAAASAKLAETRKNLDLLLKQRDRLAKEAGLSGLAQTEKEKLKPLLVVIGVIAFVGLFLNGG